MQTHSEESFHLDTYPDVAEAEAVALGSFLSGRDYYLAVRSERGAALLMQELLFIL